MGVASIDEVLDYQVLLDEYHDDGREPNPMAKSMSWMKTNVKLVMDESADDTLIL